MADRKITVKSGNEESTLEVTEEEYRNYYRPWWQQKKGNRSQSANLLKSWAAPDNRVFKENSGAGETPVFFSGKRVGCLKNNHQLV